MGLGAGWGLRIAIHDCRRWRARRRALARFVLATVTVMGTLMCVAECPENGFTSIPAAFYRSTTTTTTLWSLFQVPADFEVIARGQAGGSASPKFQLRRHLVPMSELAAIHRGSLPP